MDKLKFLHVGCGPKKQNQTTPVFNSEDWTEVRFDIDETHNPDILGSMTDMSMIDDNSFNAIYSSHNIEHLFLHEAEIAVKEFYRILKPSGYVFLLCPDIVQASKALYENGPNSKFYSTDGVDHAFVNFYESGSVERVVNIYPVDMEMRIEENGNIRRLSCKGSPD